MDLKYYYFGSADSLDTDVLVHHPEATGTDSDSSLVDELRSKFPMCIKWDINIVKIDGGYVTKSIPSKGNVDSVNNSLYQTYHLHVQDHEQPIIGNLPRQKLLAVVRCIRAILLSVKKTSQYKLHIRPALKADFIDRLDALLKVSYDQPPFSKEEDNLDEYKRVAFRIGQTLSLLDGIEIYTKEDFIRYHPDLAAIINRASMPILGQMEAKIAELYHVIQRMGIVQMDKDIVQWNQFKANFKTEDDIL
ncbi:hypothetical protein TH53_24985 [Pedobacter lusitanus]|uniref:Uncharacterized protein n=1 Tax=Pedobacter lusitanus TaxID=1503925 RepID=A0A0D0GBN7_9SPHI|nr:hypothetical protein [Pedobacter lusitanus]KIO74687.1 hypothetical protein TH53_24985 [Pedobacter lusitanus]